MQKALIESLEISRIVVEGLQQNKYLFTSTLSKQGLGISLSKAMNSKPGEEEMWMVYEVDIVHSSRSYAYELARR